MVKQHSTPWQERADSLKSIRSDYESMRNKLGIAVKRIELMAAEVSECKIVCYDQTFTIAWAIKVKFVKFE